MDAHDSKRALPSWLPLAGGLAVAALGLILLWALVIKADDDASDAPRIVDAGELADAADAAGHPIYWIGERDGKQIELAESDNGRIYVRYLDEGVEPGVRSTKYLTVVTYPVPDAAAALRRGLAKRPNAELARGDDGAVVLIDPATPGSVRIAHPGADQQVELYTPDIEQSIRLATDGTVQPVD